MIGWILTSGLARRALGLTQGQKVSIRVDSVHAMG